MTIFAQYKGSAVCTHEINIWRHIRNANKQVELLKLNLDTKLSMKTFDENSCIRAIEKLIDRAFQSITLVLEYRDRWHCNMLNKDRCSRLSETER